MTNHVREWDNIVGFFMVRGYGSTMANFQSIQFIRLLFDRMGE